MTIIEKIDYNLKNTYDVSAFTVASFSKKELVIAANYFRNLGYTAKVELLSSSDCIFLLTVYR